MKSIFVVFLFTAANISYANDCEVINKPKDVNLTITRDSDPNIFFYHVRLPQNIKDEKLESLVLTAHIEIDGKLHDLALPLAIKSKAETTGSYFALSSNWLNIEVIGSYGTDHCTQISANISI